MAIRTLKRKVIIREYDFNKIKDHALGHYYADNMSLYDRVSFMPLNQEALEKLQVERILRGKDDTLTETPWPLELPAVFLYQLRDYLYNTQYYNWNPTIDEEGYICVQARKNTPKTRIGWGVFEKDLQCRL